MQFRHPNNNKNKMKCGGFGKDKSPTSEEHELLNSLKSEIEEKLSKTFNDSFEIISFQTQVVAGLNYIFKVKCNEDEYIHVKVCKPLPHTQQKPFVMNVVTNVTKDSPIEPI